MQAIRVADDVRASIKRAKKSANDRSAAYDAKRKITIESFTNPTPIANVGGLPPLPKSSNAVLIFNVSKKFHSNLKKYGWEVNPKDSSVWCFTGSDAERKEAAFVQCLDTLGWPFECCTHFAGDYMNKFVSADDRELFRDNFYKFSRMTKQP